MEKKTPLFLKDDSFIYFVVIVLLIIIFIIEGMFIYAASAGLVLVIITAFTLRKQILRNKELKNYVINYTKNLENLSINSFYYSPLPICIIGLNGKMFWFNNKFKELLSGDSDVIENIEEFVGGFPSKSMDGNKEGTISNIEVPETGRSFNVLYYELEEGRFGEGRSYVCYWNENTAFITLKNKYNDERPITMLIQIDNYEEISEKLELGEKSSMTAQTEKILNNYAAEMNGFVLKYDNYKFLMIIENKYLETLEAKKFSMLDDVKSIRGTNDFNFTLSIGTGAMAKNLTQLMDYSKGALDVALGRGGDQAVVKRINSVKFYGGKSKAVEKRTKVRARIISYALRQIIDQSSNVIIMGHRVGDMDSLGSAIGIYSIAKSRGKKSYIVLNNVNHALKNMYERMKKEESHYIESIITTEKALELSDQNTLIVVLDTHRKSYTEAPELIDQIDKVVLIDHHRRSEEYIENTLLDYIEPYASSTCELVAELIQYMEEHIKLTKFEADALMAGIVVDTNSFTFKTGIRTFEAAAFLKRRGADNVEVKELFNESIEFMKKKTEIIERSEIVFDDVAVSYIDETTEDSNVAAAQSADELLTIKDVNMSFVLVRNKEYINISGRSVGDMNVQVILEYLGGGGHLNMAGAQVYTTDMEEAKAKLYEAIAQYKKEIKP
ncbi:MAG TPA: phosphoesterase [Clostridiales bacterium]|jgi:c-di-AMP phosphodiesterase-like protein|nr:phosphoesterase [Clostridiales bacterium]HCS11477.1 phosphoesterase [Clostridiales bacterium]